MVISSCFYPDIKISNNFFPWECIFVGHEQSVLDSKGLSIFLNVDIFRSSQICVPQVVPRKSASVCKGPVKVSHRSVSQIAVITVETAVKCSFV